MPDLGSLFQLKVLNRVTFRSSSSRKLCQVPGEPLLEFWSNQFILFSFETLQIHQVIHDVIFFRLATLPTWQNFSRTWLQKCPEMKDNSEIEFTFSMKFRNRLKTLEFWGTNPSPPESRGSSVLLVLLQDLKLYSDTIFFHICWSLNKFVFVKVSFWVLQVNSTNLN